MTTKRRNASCNSRFFPITEIHDSTATYLENADFETFTAANTPDDWSIASGTVGTNIKSNTANVAHGTTSLNFIGDGSTASIQVSQAPLAGTLNARQRYLVSAQIKADASIGAGTLTIEFSGTGYTPGSGESISIAPGNLPTSYQPNHFFVTMPAAVPSDMKLIVHRSSLFGPCRNVVSRCAQHQLRRMLKNNAKTMD